MKMADCDEGDLRPRSMSGCCSRTGSGDERTAVPKVTDRVERQRLDT